MVRNQFEHLEDGPKGKVQDVLCKMPLATKVFNRKKWLILGRQLRSRYECSFPARCKHFNLVTGTAMMIGTQSRLPCRAVQLGEAVLLRSPVSPMSFAPRTSHFLLKP